MSDYLIRKSAWAVADDLFRAMPSRMPETAAEKQAHSMMTAGGNSLPAKAPQSKGGVQCPSCGHHHKPGTLCPWDKGIVVEKSGIPGHTGGNPYHGKDGRFTTQAGAVAVTPAKGQPAEPVSESAKPPVISQKQKNKEAAKKYWAGRKEHVENRKKVNAELKQPKVKEDDTYVDVDLPGQANKPVNAPKQPKVKEDATYVDVDAPVHVPDPTTVDAKPGDPNKTNPGGPKGKQKGQQIGTDPTVSADSSVTPGNSHQERARQAAYDAWSQEFNRHLVDGVHPQEASKRAREAALKVYQDHLSGKIPVSPAQGTPAGGAPGGNNPKAPKQPARDTVVDPSIRPVKPSYDPDKTYIDPSVVPSKPQIQPTKPQTRPGTPQQAPRQPSTLPQPSPVVRRPQTSIGFGTGGLGLQQGYGAGYAIGAGLGTPGGTVSPTSNAAMQQVHHLLNPHLRREIAPIVRKSYMSSLEEWHKKNR